LQTPLLREFQHPFKVPKNVPHRLHAPSSMTDAASKLANTVRPTITIANMSASPQALQVGVFSGTKDLDEQPPLIATKGHDAPLSALISPPAVVTQSVMPENLEGMTPESVEKTAQFRYEKVLHDLEEVKARLVHSEEERVLLKKQLEEGAKRREQIKKIEKMMPEFRRQIEEARAENEELSIENERLRAELEKLMKASGGNSEEEKLLLEAKDKLMRDMADARVQLESADRKAEIERKGFKQQIERMHSQTMEDTEELAKLRRVVDHLKEENTKVTSRNEKLKEQIELLKAQLSIPMPSMALPGMETRKTGDSKLVKNLEEKVKLLEKQLDVKNKFIKSMARH